MRSKFFAYTLKFTKVNSVMRKTNTESFLSEFWKGIKSFFSAIFSFLADVVRMIMKAVFYSWALTLSSLLVFSLSFWLITAGMKNLGIDFNIINFIGNQVMKSEDGFELMLDLDWEDEAMKDETLGKFANEMADSQPVAGEQKYKAGEIPDFIKEELKEVAEKLRSEEAVWQ